MKSLLKQDKLSVLVGMEGLSYIGEDVDMLHYFYDVVGARHASLTWNEQNALATGVGGDPLRDLQTLVKTLLESSKN